VFVKRDIISQYLFNEDRHLSGSEDYELWLRLAARYSIYTYSSSTACLVNHNTRSVVSTNEHKLLLRLDLLRKYLFADKAFMNYYCEKVNRFDAFLDLYGALHLAMDGNVGEARGKLAMAIKKFPFIIFTFRFWVALRKVLGTN
jgi:hypothetical protein